MAITLTHALTEVAREDLPIGIRDTLPEVSGLFRDIKTTWEGVEKSLGRPGRLASTGAFYDSGWVRRWTICAGGGGAFQFKDPNPTLVTALGDSGVGDSNQGVWSGTTTGRNLSASDFVFPRYANPYVGLKEGRGVLAMPWQLLRATKIENVLLDVGADNIQKAAELTALSEAICFFSRNPTWGEVARTGVHKAVGTEGHAGVAATSFGGSANQKYLTVSDWWDEDTVTKFRPGMSLDAWEVFYDDSEDDLKIKALDANGWVVDQVDYINQKVTLVTKDAGNAANAPLTGAANDLYCYIFTLQGTCALAGATPETGVTLDASITAGLVSPATESTQMDTIDGEIIAYSTYTAYGMEGLTDFVKTAASQSFYGVPIARIPNLLSLYVANVADYLTERKWNNYIGWFRSQYGEKFMPDTIVTTFGVLNGALQTAFRFEPASPALTHPLINMNVDRDGGTSPALGMDFGGVKFGHRGRTFKLYDDPICPRGNLFALKTRDDNFMRLVPPPIPGAGKQPRFQEVEFINPMVLKGIWNWARNSSGQQTDFMEAPYVLTANHYVKDPQAIRLRGLTEAVGI